MKRIFTGPLLVASLAFSDPSVSGNFTMGDAASNKQSLRKIWGNFLAGYQQARNMAKGVVRQMQLTSSLAHSLEYSLKAWEDVAQQTEALMKADIWDSDPIALVENLEENFFQKSDKLLYYTTPNAKRASRDFNTTRAAWVNNLEQLTNPGAELQTRRAAGVAKTLALGKSQTRQESQEKSAFALRNSAIIKSGLRRDELVYMSDNADANISAAGKTLREIEDSKQNEMADFGKQSSENDLTLNNVKTVQEMDRIELFSHVLLSKASAYNRAALGSYLLVSPLVEFSDALRNLKEEP